MRKMTRILFLVVFLFPLGVTACTDTPSREEAIQMASTVVVQTWVANVVHLTMQAEQTASFRSPTPVQTHTLTPFPSVTAIPSKTPEPTLRYSLTPSASAAPSLTPSITLPASFESGCVPTETERQFGRVIGIVNGDTIRVRVGTEDFLVGYLGVDAPDLGARYGTEITQINAERYLWQWVTLVKSNRQFSESERALRYVFTENSFINYDLIGQGHALAADDLPDYSCKNLFEQAEAEARAFRLNYWAIGPTSTPWPPDPHITPSRTPSPTVTQTPVIPPDPRCTCYGPPLACTDFRTQKAAQACYDFCVDLGYGNVYGLDGPDTDTLACESLP